MFFHERLKALRLEKGWSQAELATKSNLTQPFVSDMESGNKKPGYDSLISLSQALRVTVADLLDEKPV